MVTVPCLTPPPPFINACSYIYVSLCTALADSSRVLLLLFYRHQERTLTMKTISAHTIQMFLCCTLYMCFSVHVYGLI